jgi:hypothetical protein
MSHKIIAEDGKLRQHRRLLKELLDSTKGPIRVASAYLTDTKLLRDSGKRKVQLLTSLTRMDIVSGATSLDALKFFVDSGVQCRCISDGPRLHSKVYIFGDFAVVTSANLTGSALDRNIETGVRLAGKAVGELANWFDALWKSAKPLDTAQISEWQKQTAELKRQYARMREQAETIPDLPNEASADPQAPSTLRDLLDRVNDNHTSSNYLRSYLCNTDRTQQKRPPFRQEELMNKRGLAAAWLPFDYKTHMKEVRPGQLIFMYANSVGVVGIGEATGRCAILKPGDPARLVKEGETEEWRVPVEWRYWDDDHPCPWKLRRSPTFKDVSGPKYDNQREAVRKYIQSIT